MREPGDATRVQPSDWPWTGCAVTLFEFLKTRAGKDAPHGAETLEMAIVCLPLPTPLCSPPIVRNFGNGMPL